MTQITEQYPYPTLSTQQLKYAWKKTAVSKEDAKQITKWCRNPQRVKEVIRRFQIWSLNHQYYADEQTREWVEENIEQIKKDLDIYN